MPLKVIRKDVVIVGGGILGLITAALLAPFRSVTLYVDPGEHGLGADTLRNQAWLQSGLVYTGPFTASSCRTLYWDGREMLDAFGIPRPQSGGVFSFHDNASREAFEANVMRLGLKREHGVHRLTNDEARYLLAELYDGALAYYRVPDSVFDEADSWRRRVATRSTTTPR